MTAARGVDCVEEHVRVDHHHRAVSDPSPSWGVRGGGGNFGIVTEFEFRSVPLGQTVLAGPVFWLMEESPGCCASTAT